MYQTFSPIQNNYTLVGRRIPGTPQRPQTVRYSKHRGHSSRRRVTRGSTIDENFSHKWDKDLRDGKIEKAFVRPDNFRFN